MYDSLTATSPHCKFAFRGAAAERRETAKVSARTLARVLDVIDYGVLLVLDDSYVVFANHIARQELDEVHPLQVLGQEIRARRPQDVAPVRGAIADACLKGLQRMLAVGDDHTERSVVSVVPMPDLGPAGECGAMLVFARRRSCADLTADAFARHHALTPAEVRVLKQLCAGRQPMEIANAQGVALSTVRTQIGSLRDKTESPSIGALLRQVSRLPPMALRVPA
jgi:DNA-binding CsgD family transcriptional regulator